MTLHIHRIQRNMNFQSRYIYNAACGLREHTSVLLSDSQLYYIKHKMYFISPLANSLTTGTKTNGIYIHTYIYIYIYNTHMDCNSLTIYVSVATIPENLCFSLSLLLSHCSIYYRYTQPNSGDPPHWTFILLDFGIRAFSLYFKPLHFFFLCLLFFRILSLVSQTLIIHYVKYVYV